MNIKLQKLSLEFAKDIKSALNDSKITDNLRDLPNPYTEQNAVEFIKSVLGSENDYIFAITVEGRFVGCISAIRMQNIHSRIAEIGYYVIPEYWNRGVASYALKCLTEFIFTNSDIVRLFAEPFSRNIASCRVLEKAGFSYEGTLKSNAIKNGIVEDMKVYALIKN